MGSILHNSIQIFSLFFQLLVKVTSEPKNNEHFPSTVFSQVTGFVLHTQYSIIKTLCVPLGCFLLTFILHNFHHPGHLDDAVGSCVTNMVRHRITNSSHTEFYIAAQYSIAVAIMSTI